MPTSVLDDIAVSNMSTDKSRTCWDERCTRIFLEQCIDQILKKERQEDEWWDWKVQENPDYAKYRYHGIKFVRELEIVFKDGMTSGSTQFSPSARRQMPPRDDGDDVYRPTMDLEEGSGDSEEQLPGATTGVSALLEGLNLTISTQPSAPSGSASIGKRKRGQESNGGRRKKMSASKQIADSLSVIATATKDRTQQLQNINHERIWNFP
ncbi:hypothetical protein K1719_004376 [Acacia pycnantha]|nr:hypothetical protein K1719_004376 [Acacia pycnantha]